MAQVTRSHGDFQQVMNFDTGAYTVGAIDAVTSAVTVQPQGPKLDFFTIAGNATQVLDNISTVFATVTQLATVHMYQVNSDGIMSIALYPAAAWTAAALQVAVRALGTVDSFALAAVDVTTGGFTLA